MADRYPAIRRRWRHYATPSGRQPTRTFVNRLRHEDQARIAGAMRAVSDDGLRAARHLRGDLYEVRILGNPGYRVVFATAGRHSHVLIALHIFKKPRQRTPQAHLVLAEQRLADWRRRGID